ncbi:hypothetical protein Tco_1057768 [Tanacetum coccineum]|uniref:Uncharacterized protein n=1 Tax=Tanacetum coccineum TaxID=301880 RepID=A0ABQ5H794_9ASTR
MKLFLGEDAPRAIPNIGFNLVDVEGLTLIFATLEDLDLVLLGDVISEDDYGDDGKDENVFIIGERTNVENFDKTVPVDVDDVRYVVETNVEVESFKDKDSWESYHELFNPFVRRQGMFVDVENSKIEIT